MTWHYPALAHFAAKPESIAFRIDTQVKTWSALNQETQPLARAWRARIVPGQSLALTATRDLRTLLHLHALIRAGVPVALIAPGITAQEHATACTILQPDQIADDELLTLVETEARAAADVRAQSPWDDAPWNEARVLARILTSGTTGTPKAIELRASQVIASTLAGVSRLGALPDDIWLSPLPWHHVGGLMVILRSLILGFQAELTPHFEAGTIVEQLRSEKIRLASFVPVMLERILDHVGPDAPRFDELRAILLGGAATPPALLERARALALPVARSWGMSESASQIATAAPGDFENPLAPLPFVRIEDDAGRFVLDGPQVMGGRFVTSDRGELSERGVIIRGRADDVFISGGENIDPVEIEDALRSHASVVEALVVGIEVPQWGQRPCAFVRIHARLDESPIEGDDDQERVEALRVHVAARVQRFKIPDYFFIVKDIPRNSMGKPDRGAARKFAEEQITAHARTSTGRNDQGAKA